MYRLMSKDKLLASFHFFSAEEWEAGLRAGRRERIGRVAFMNDAVHLLPLEFLNVRRLTEHGESELTLHTLRFPGDAMEAWLFSRRVPKNRRHAGHIVEELGVSYDDLEGLVRASCALSLTDSYWVKHESDARTWRDVNLFENPLDASMANVAYMGYRDGRQGDGSVGTSRFYTRFRSTPEITTDGAIAKAWVRWEGRPHLFKSGTSGFANSGLEPYSEFLAAQVAERMGLSCVPYELAFWHGRLSSVCPLFTSLALSFVPFSRFCNKNAMRDERFEPNIEGVLSACSTLGIEERFLDLFLFDAVIRNTDRHLGNFGFIRDSDTGKLWGLAPPFDHGMSLLHECMDKDMTDKGIAEYLERRHPALVRMSFEDAVREYVPHTPQRAAALRKLLTFEFVPPPERFGFSARRLKALSRFVSESASRCLESMRPEVRSIQAPHDHPESGARTPCEPSL